MVIDIEVSTRDYAMRIWATASEMAAKTPPERNRYVDFLRAVSIMVVVIGHWTIATAWYVDGNLTPGHLLKSHPQTQWLTWFFQVMPIFFIVGGYSNAVSLESAKRKGIGYSGWLAARLHRLVSPSTHSLVAWAATAFAMKLMDTRPAVVQFTSQAALIPTWFLAIYIDARPACTGCIQVLAALWSRIVLLLRRNGGHYGCRFLCRRHEVAGLDQLLLGLARGTAARLCVARWADRGCWHSSGYFGRWIDHFVFADSLWAVSAGYGRLARQVAEQYIAAQDHPACARLFQFGLLWRSRSPCVAPCKACVFGPQPC